NDDVRVDRVLLGQTPSHLLAGVVNRHPVDDGIRPGKVDVLHRADCQLGIRRVVVDVEAVAINDNQLTRLDVADEFGVDNVQGAGLTGHHVGTVSQLTNAERPNTVRVEG